MIVPDDLRTSKFHPILEPDISIIAWSVRLPKKTILSLDPRPGPFPSILLLCVGKLKSPNWMPLSSDARVQEGQDDGTIAICGWSSIRNIATRFPCA